MAVPAGAETPTRREVLRVQDISKSFSGVRALRGVTLDVRAGEVLALMGENGAGKSTLLKILSGDQLADSGTVTLAGQTVAFASPAVARKSGLRVIYQEPEIVPHVSVAENVFLGGLPHRGPFVDRRALNQQMHESLRTYGFEHALRPETLGSQLSAAQRQLVEILRALTSDVKVLAFDEPTSSLSDSEVESLFTLIRRLRDSGVGIIYVSHRMREIFQIADRVAVLRDGALVGVREAAGTTDDDLVRMMVGRDLSDMFAAEHTAPEEGDAVLSLRSVTTDDVRDISLDVRGGEVVGLAGLVGAGRSELVHAVVGDVPIRSGQVLVNGQVLRLRAPSDAIDAGIGFAPEERKRDALILARGVRDNISLAMLERLRRFRIVLRGAERRLAESYVEQLRIRTPFLDQEVRKLSGGNQQKVVLARWLARKPKVLILDEPTRGVDVGAKAEIYAIVDSLARDGVAVLVISSELPEVLGLCDRIVVMAGGRITGELSRADATEEKILALAMTEEGVAS